MAKYAKLFHIPGDSKVDAKGELGMYTLCGKKMNWSDNGNIMLPCPKCQQKLQKKGGQNG